MVWLPPRSAGERTLGAEPCLLLSLADSGGAGATLRRASLETLPPLRSVRLVFDARDVTLLSSRLPPLPSARLLRALPNLFEDQVLQDAQQCAWALAPGPSNEERLVAAIDRQWLETVVQAFERRGIRVTSAWPAQALRLAQPNKGLALLCAGNSLAALVDSGQGVGLGAGADPQSRRETIGAALALFGDQAKDGLTVYATDSSWSDGAREEAAARGIEARFAPLPVPIASAIDLMQARRSGSFSRILGRVDIRAWRWPVWIGAASAALAVVGLNAHWFVLRDEQASLRTRLDESFAQVFPSGTARVDPVLQLRRHVATLRSRAGQSSPDDFVALTASLGTALGTQAQDAVNLLEYREGRLRVRFRPGMADSRASRDSIEQAARRQGLRLQFESEREPLATVTVLR